VSQLKALRERLSERRVLDQIKGRLQGFGLTDASIAQNSNFIVVHTLPYFNAYMNDGVALYEWNFFRNLLLRGATQRAKVPIGQWGLLRPLATLSHHETLHVTFRVAPVGSCHQSCHLSSGRVTQKLKNASKINGRYFTFCVTRQML
jgi:hypothetical protein